MAPHFRRSFWTLQFFAAAKSENGPEKTVKPPPSPLLGEGKIPPALVITAEPDNDSLYISDGTAMPLWVHVQPEHKLIALVTYHDTAPVEAPVGAEAANRVNGTLILGQFHYREGRLWAHPWLNYSEGLSARSFIRMMRLFAEISGRAHHEDPALFAPKCHNERGSEDRRDPVQTLAVWGTGGLISE
jgi:hypothetical protein